LSASAFAEAAPAIGDCICQDAHTWPIARAIIDLPADVVWFGMLFFGSSSSIRAEHLVLRRQLARHIWRGVKPRRVDHATRVCLPLFTRLCDWRDGFVNVRPSTIVRWHRLGWRTFWRLKCGAGRPLMPLELRKLIRRMTRENPLRGQERIANEVLLKPRDSRIAADSGEVRAAAPTRASARRPTLVDIPEESREGNSGV
jgi:hypothetical protein